MKLIFPNNRQYINIHTHRKALNTNEYVVRSVFHSTPPKHLKDIQYAISAGIHPWHTKNDSIDAAIQQLEQLLALPNVIALGETGLDRACNNSWDTQIQYFEKQLDIAQKHRLPLIIHAVRSYSDLMPYLKRATVPFIFHQYMGNDITTKQLLRYHTYFSFGINLLKHPKSRETILNIPKSRLFLETDIYDISIEKIYLETANILNQNLEDLKTQIFCNFADVFMRK